MLARVDLTGGTRRIEVVESGCRRIDIYIESNGLLLARFRPILSRNLLVREAETELLVAEECACGMRGGQLLQYSLSNSITRDVKFRNSKVNEYQNAIIFLEISD